MDSKVHGIVPQKRSVPCTEMLNGAAQSGGGPEAAVDKAKKSGRRRPRGTHRPAGARGQHIGDWRVRLRSLPVPPRASRSRGPSQAAYRRQPRPAPTTGRGSNGARQGERCRQHNRTADSWSGRRRRALDTQSVAADGWAAPRRRRRGPCLAASRAAMRSGTPPQPPGPQLRRGRPQWQAAGAEQTAGCRQPVPDQRHQPPSCGQR